MDYGYTVEKDKQSLSVYWGKDKHWKYTTVECAPLLTANICTLDKKYASLVFLNELHMAVDNRRIPLRVQHGIVNQLKWIVFRQTVSLIVKRY